MAVISINIPDNQLSRVIDGICLGQGYQATINGSPNPETKGQFAKRMLIEKMKQMVMQGEYRAVIDSIKTGVTPT